MRKVWQKHELEFIRLNADRMKDEELALELTKRLGRKVTKAAVRKQRQQLQIFKKNGRGVCEIKKQTLPFVGRGVRGISK